MDKVEAELNILMSEKEHADKQIGSYLELQVKVHTFIFTAAAAAAAGWIFARKEGDLSSPEVRSAAVLVLAFLGSFAILQGIIVYGIVLGYIRYKNKVVGNRIKDLLGLDRNPLMALQAIASSSSNRIVMTSSIFGGVFLLGISGGLLGYAFLLWQDARARNGLLLGGLLVCAILWLGILISGLGLVRSMGVLQREAKSERVRVAFPPADGDDFAQHLVAAHQPFFEVFTQASTAANNVLTRLEVDRTDNMQLYLACAFARLCEACQAAAYLAARGFTQETAVEVRVALEALLKMKAAIVKPDFAEDVINSDLFEQRKLVNLVLNGEAGDLTPENRPEVEVRKAEIEQEIATRNARKISIEEIAREVDGLGLYHNVYRLTSSNVHVSPRSLGQYLRLHPETGHPEQVVYGPSDAYAEIHVCTVTEFLLIAISLLERHRQIPPPADFAAIGAAFRSLSPEWPSS
jgi:hypothetical protein